MIGTAPAAIRYWNSISERLARRGATQEIRKKASIGYGRIVTGRSCPDIKPVTPRSRTAPNNAVHGAGVTNTLGDIMVYPHLPDQGSY
jgi:hypothetical protein